jgi:hypothetical protein
MTLTETLDQPQTGIPDLDAAVLAARVRELEGQLARERARCAGLEQGIASLTATVTDLRARLDTPRG